MLLLSADAVFQRNRRQTRWPGWVRRGRVPAVTSDPAVAATSSGLHRSAAAETVVLLPVRLETVKPENVWKSV